MVGMLKFGQLFCDAVSMVIVDEGDGADDGGIGTRGPLRDQAVANQVAKGFGAVGVSEPGDEIIEAGEQIGVECDANSTENAHVRSLDEIGL